MSRVPPLLPHRGYRLSPASRGGGPRIPVFAGKTMWGLVGIFSQQSPMPAAADAPRYENRVRAIGSCLRRLCPSPPHGYRVSPVRRARGWHPERVIFVPIFHAGCHRHHGSRKWGLPIRTSCPPLHPTMGTGSSPASRSGLAGVFSEERLQIPRHSRASLLPRVAYNPTL